MFVKGRRLVGWGSVFILPLIALLIIQLDLGYCYNYVWKEWIFREIRPCHFNHSYIRYPWISLTTDQTCQATDIAIYIQVRFADSHYNDPIIDIWIHKLLLTYLLTYKTKKYTYILKYCINVDCMIQFENNILKCACSVNYKIMSLHD